MRSDPVAVLLPGAGSSASFVTRAFGPVLAERGYSLVAVPPEPGPDVVAAAAAALDSAREEYGSRLGIVGGVSLGAHVAARWAAAHPGSVEGLLLAFPAWTGPPGPVAAATAGAAAEVERLGIEGAVEAARAGAVGWVADELAAAWPAYGDALPATLRAAAAPGPTVAELASIDVPVGLAACVDDPLHPFAVAERWAAALPHALLARLPLAALGPDRSLLGAAAVTALTYATRARDRALEG